VASIHSVAILAQATLAQDSSTDIVRWSPCQQLRHWLCNDSLMYRVQGCSHKAVAHFVNGDYEWLPSDKNHGRDVFAKEPDADGVTALIYFGMGQKAIQQAGISAMSLDAR